MNYRLIVIENSLTDKSVLSQYKVLSETKFSEGTDRESRMLKLLVPKEDISSLSTQLMNNIAYPYYCHLYAEDPESTELVVIFKNKMFKTSKQEYNDAIQYGTEHEVSRDEMNISPVKIAEESW